LQLFFGEDLTGDGDGIETGRETGEDGGDVDAVDDGFGGKAGGEAGFDVEGELGPGVAQGGQRGDGGGLAQLRGQAGAGENIAVAEFHDKSAEIRGDVGQTVLDGLRPMGGQGGQGVPATGIAIGHGACSLVCGQGLACDQGEGEQQGGRFGHGVLLGLGRG